MAALGGDVEELQLLSGRLSDFQKLFKAKNVDRTVALRFADQLLLLSNHIRSSYSTATNINGTGAPESPILQADVYSPRKSTRGTTKIKTPNSTPKYRDACKYAEKRQKLENEGNEIVSKSTKSPSASQCGVGYPGTFEEKQFTDTVKLIIQKHVPALRIKKNMFHYMAFATLDRFYCTCSLDCSNTPASLNKWITENQKTISVPSAVVSSTSGQPMPSMVCVDFIFSVRFYNDYLNF